MTVDEKLFGSSIAVCPMIEYGMVMRVWSRNKFNRMVASVTTHPEPVPCLVRLCYRGGTNHYQSGALPENELSFCDEHWNDYSQLTTAERRTWVDRKRRRMDVSEKTTKENVSKVTKHGGTKSVSADKVTTKKKSSSTMGRTLGLKMDVTWCKLFNNNLSAVVARRKTDAQILSFMRTEFPERDAVQNADVKVVKQKRSYFNGGHYWDGDAPTTPSVAFDKNGAAIKPWSRGSGTKSNRPSGNRPSAKRTKKKASARVRVRTAKKVA